MAFVIARPSEYTDSCLLSVCKLFNWAYVRQGVYFWAYGTPGVLIFGVFFRAADQRNAEAHQ